MPAATVPLQSITISQKPPFDDTMTKVKSILGLPLDVLHLIVKEFEYEELDPLRLTHPSLRDIAAIYRFRRIYITFDEQTAPDYDVRLGRLLEGVEYENMRSHVRKITIKIRVAPKQHTCGQVYQYCMERQGKALERAFVGNRSFARLEKVTLAVECADRRLGRRTTGLLDVVEPIELEKICDTLKALKAPDDAVANGDQRIPRKLHVEIQFQTPVVKWQENFVDALPPMDAFSVEGPQTLAWETRNSFLPSTINAINNSPDMTDLSIFTRNSASTDGRMDGLLAKLTDPQALTKIQTITMAPCLFSEATDMSRFKALRKVMIRGDERSPTSTFPWDAAVEMEIRLVEIEVREMNESFVNYLNWLPEKHVKILGTHFPVPSAQFSAEPELVSANSKLAADFWLAVARHQNSLERLDVDPSVNEEDDMNEEWDWHCVRLDPYMPWTPTSKEFEDARISFKKLTLANFITAFMPDLDEYPEPQLEITRASGINPSELRFDRIMNAFKSFEGMTNLTLIFLKNICGLYRREHDFEPAMWHEADHAEVHLIDNTSSTAHMQPAILNYTFPEGVETRQSWIGKVILLTLAAGSGNEDGLITYLLKEGKWAVERKGLYPGLNADEPSDIDFGYFDDDEFDDEFDDNDDDEDDGEDDDDGDDDGDENEDEGDEWDTEEDEEGVDEEGP